MARLFPNVYAANPLDDTEIEQIVKNLSSNVISGSMPAGYTYFLQFLSHDIIPSQEKGSRINVSPYLSFESIYWPLDKLENIDDHGKFKMSDSNSDVARTSDSCIENLALIPEPRNDKNVLVLQIHVLIQMLHNRIVDFYIEQNNHTPIDPKETNYLKAKKAIVALLHHITVNEVLVNILDPRIFDHYFVKGGRGIISLKESLTSIPLEFSESAIRFAHTMIRGAYLLNDKLEDNGNRTVIGFNELSRRTKLTGLEEHYFVDWKYLFGSSAQHANQLDTRVTKTITSFNNDLFNPTSNLESRLDVNEIVQRDLIAEAKWKIPNPKEIRRYLKKGPRRQNFNWKSSIEYKLYRKFLKNLDMPKNDGSSDQIPLFDQLSSRMGNTSVPLFLSTLMSNNETQPAPHQKLDPATSLIIAEVMRASIYGAVQDNDASGCLYKGRKKIDWEAYLRKSVPKELLSSLDHDFSIWNIIKKLDLSSAESRALNHTKTDFKQWITEDTFVYEAGNFGENFWLIRYLPRANCQKVNPTTYRLCSYYDIETNSLKLRVGGKLGGMLWDKDAAKLIEAACFRPSDEAEEMTISSEPLNIEEILGRKLIDDIQYRRSSGDCSAYTHLKYVITQPDADIQDYSTQLLWSPDASFLDKNKILAGPTYKWRN